MNLGFPLQLMQTSLGVLLTCGFQSNSILHGYPSTSALEWPQYAILELRIQALAVGNRRAQLALVFPVLWNQSQ